MSKRIWLVMLALLVSRLCTAAEPVTGLESWSHWLAQEHPQLRCPWSLKETSPNEKPQRQCLWPGSLQLDVSDRGASFTLYVTVYGQRALVALPGDAVYWPQEVLLDGRPAPLVQRSGLPHLSLQQGDHRVTGRIAWQRPPGQLTLPEYIALVALNRDGAEQAVDRRGNQLLLSNRNDSPAVQGRDSLAIEVYRKLSDGIPLILETRIRLIVSGRSRELLFGRALPADNELLQLTSPVPARLEADGSVRAQAGPGEHELILRSRLHGDPATLQLVQPLTAEWPRVEYLSFEPDPGLRQLRLSGTAAIDASQIPLPPQWSQLTTYRLDADTPLTLTTESRGEQAPAANELRVRRDIWFDFDGDGMTSLDRINGRMHRDWRLDAAQSSRIGRASVDSEPVLITRHGEREGIEIRHPAINMEAVTRQPSVGSLPAVGWESQADSYSATVHLPPGWRMLHASGVDEVQGTWLSRWDLWDVFLLLIIVAATRKLFGNRTALLAFAAYLLALQETGTPLLLIPPLLIIIALLPLGVPWIKNSLRVTGGVLAVALVLALLGFAVDAFRLAIFPSLERATVGQYRVPGYDTTTDVSNQVRQDMSLQSAPQQTLKIAGSRPAREAPQSSADDHGGSLYQLAEGDRVQTGPGLPTWTWNAVSLNSSGPVAASQMLEFYYVRPWLTSLWRVLMVLLAGLYSAIVLQRFASLLREQPRSVTAAPALLAIAFALLGTGAPEPALAQGNSPNYSPNYQASYAPHYPPNYPPNYILEKLEQRLLRAPQCLPDCLSFNNARLTLQDEALLLDVEVYADTDLAAPLPDTAGQTQWRSVHDASGLLSLARDANGQLLVALAAGHHRLQLRGVVIGEQATLTFPLPFHNLEVQAPGWQVAGLVDGRLLNNTLSLSRIEQSNRALADSLRSDPAPVFVRVQRRLNLQQQWRLHTTVIREAPASGPLSVAVPLLQGEKLLTDIGRQQDGILQLEFASGQRRLSWVSSMEPVPQLQLQAATDRPLVEEWQFIPSSRWRLSYQGLPQFRQSAAGSSLTPVFKPWPGETLQVQVQRPEGVAGPTYTVESATLTYNAGARLQKSSLQMQVQASLGEDYQLQLPDDAEVLRLTYAGRELNLPPGRQVTVPLQPGQHLLELEFQQAGEPGIVHASPRIGLPDSASNLRIQYHLPKDRWPLYLTGPAIGPAMLYWGVLCVILLAAMGLSWLARRLQLQMPIALSGWILLGLGLSTVNAYGVLVAAVFFFALAWRQQKLDPFALTRPGFNLVQVCLVIWGVLTACSILSAIPMGLLADPEMKVVGNGSRSHVYNYYQDMSAAAGFPRVTVVSVPMLVYRMVMLLWSLWLSMKIIEWARWGWQCYSQAVAWRRKDPAPAARDAEE